MIDVGNEHPRRIEDDAPIAVARDRSSWFPIHTTDPANTQTLVAIAGTGFGQGAKLDQQNTIWQGEKAWAQLSQNPGTGEGTLFIGDCELSRQLGEYEQRAAAEAAAQL